MNTVRTVTYDVLRYCGMTTVFGNPGSTELPFLKDFPEDFDYVLGLHEGTVVGMADGYAQGTGRASFVNLHTAAGLGNAMGAIVTAFHNRTPMVITAGQQDRRHLASEPRLFGRLVDLARPYVKWSHETARAEDTPAAVARAYLTAMQPPQGPAFVSVPMDDWEAEAPPHAEREVEYRTTPAPEALDRVARILRSSERPAIVAGFGIDRAGAWEETVALAEKLGATVWGDPTGIRAGFTQDHPLFGGHLAPAQASIADQLADHDVVLVVGAPVFEYFPYIPGLVVEQGTRVVQITEDPAEASRAATGMSVIGDIALTVRCLVDALPDGDRPAPPQRPKPDRPEASTPLTAASAIDTLARSLPDEAIVVDEAPSSKKLVQEFLRTNRPGGYYTTGSGGLGFAMPAAVGLKMASPERPVVCLIGDGSSMYAIQALWSAARYEVPILVFVVNNGQYTILKSFGNLIGVGEGVPGLNLPGLDPLRIAEGLGCRGERVERPDELREAIERALDLDRPYVLDVRVDPTVPELMG